MKHLILYMLAATLLWFAAPATTQRCPFRAEPELHGESPAAYQARRQAIVEDAQAVASDPAEVPVFTGPDGRARTAMLMLAIARFESGFCKLVDEGKQLGPQGEVCVMQVMVDAEYRKNVGMVTAEGWTRADLAADRRKCMRAALHKIQTSFRVCGDAKHPLNVAHKALQGADLLTLYTGTRCSEGSPYALHRYKLASDYIVAHPLPSASASP
jgi:hypothetical protein